MSSVNVPFQKDGESFILVTTKLIATETGAYPV